MPAKPKVAKLDVERLARRLQAIFPGANNFYTTTYEVKQKEGWQAGDKFEIGYKRVPSAREIKAGAPELPAPVSAYVDHIEARSGIVVPLYDVQTKTTRWGGVDIDVYNDPAKIEQIIDIVRQHESQSVFPHYTKSGGIRLLVNYGCKVSVQENVEVIEGMAHKFGFGGLKYEIFPDPKQDFEKGPDRDPAQINMPYFGSEFHVIRSKTADGYSYLTLEQFLAKAENNFMGDRREYYVRIARDNPKPKRGKAKREKVSAATYHEEGAAYAARTLKAYCISLKNSVQGAKVSESIEGRNDLLAHHAKHMGHMVNRGWILIEEVRKELTSAIQSWGNPTKDEATMESALAKGMQTPHRDLPPSAGVHFPTIVRWRKIVSEEPVWYVTIAGSDKEMEIIDVRDISDYKRFTNQCIRQLNQFFMPMKKQGDWAAALMEARHLMTEEQAPEDTTRGGEFLEHLEALLTNRQRGDHKEDILSGRPWKDEEEEKHFFQMRTLMRFLEREKMKVTRRECRAWIEELGGGERVTSVKGKSLRLWWVPSSAIQATVELDTPKLKPKAI